MGTTNAPKLDEHSQRILELVGEHAKHALLDIDEITGLAEERARDIPRTPDLVRDVRGLRTLIAEAMVEIGMLRLDATGLRRDLDRLTKRLADHQAREAGRS